MTTGAIAPKAITKTELPASASASAATAQFKSLLGLIAGGAFHDPLADGADVLLGSTNKTFFGPHRGIVLVRDDPTTFERVQAVITTPPVLQSTHHTNTAVALTVALAETVAFGAAYASAVVANARALANALDRRGVPVLVAVLVVLFVTQEFATGQKRTTYSAVPRRLPVLAAKTLVAAGAAVVLSVASSVAARAVSSSSCARSLQ